MTRRSFHWIACLIASLLVASHGTAQTTVAPRERVAARAPAPVIVIPQRRAFVTRPTLDVRITKVDAAVVIRDQLATTTLDVHLSNPGPTRAEAEVLMPVPDGAVVKQFAFQGSAAEPTAELLPRDEARQIYDRIVSQVRDPALLEFVGYSLIRSNVFPVEPRGTQRVRLTYEHLLDADGQRIDYVLPRSESIDYRVPWTVRITIESTRSVATVYSPTHELITTTQTPSRVTLQTTKAAGTEPGPLRVSYLLRDADVSASLWAYPDPARGGGYFLLLAGLPPEPDHATDIRREVTLVLDRSGSMNGEKLTQVKQVALQIIAGLEPDELFNVIVYNEAIDRFAPRPVPKTPENEKAARAYLGNIQARGGTNIHDALVEALRPKPAENVLPIVLFLTDGLPTIGQTSERVIRDAAEKGNAHQRRIFTFGVGVNVNTALLERLASQSRATATFVLPEEDVELKVAGVFRRLSGPVLASPRISERRAGDGVATARVHDLLPAQLPDVFDGDQIVLLGQYVGDEPLLLRLSGNYRGEQRTFDYAFNLDGASAQHSFVPRLWASRKIGVLVDAVRDLGANGGLTPTELDMNDPRIRELVDEIVRLSTEFGILTEYTAFLAREGTVMQNLDAIRNQAALNLQQQAVNNRSGLGGVSLDTNGINRKGQRRLNARNRYFDDRMQETEATNVRQLGDYNFYYKQGRWIDSRLVDRLERQPDRTVSFGTREHLELAHKLADQNRQASIALRGEIMIEIDGELVLVRNPQ